MKRKINVITLGCSKNLVDSEHLMAQLQRNGFEIVHDSNETDARIVVINTCGFIGDAKEESVNTILAFADAKTKGCIDHLFVMGCLAERYREELREEIPEVDEYFGVNDLRDIVKTVGGRYRDELTGERHLTTPGHYAYLKISEGCNWGCGYCAIPLIRGRHVSVPMEEPASRSGDAGRAGRPGTDRHRAGYDLLRPRPVRRAAARRVAPQAVPHRRARMGTPTLRLPGAVPDGRDRRCATNRKCKYLDIPFQHISDPQLKSMRRGLNKAQTYELIGELRRRIPGIALRTTLLTGYPGESEADFDELLEFVERVRFERLGVFPYSEEEGTYSAMRLRDDVPDKVKQRRADAIMELQNRISAENNRRRIGTQERIIIDRREGEFLVGRSQYDSPEVDTEILVETDENPSPGTFLDVKITEAGDYDLYGKIRIGKRGK